MASDDGNMHGVTVNSFSSVSLDPMLVMVCLTQTSRGVGLIERAGAFVVNVLSAGQQDLSRWFADRHRLRARQCSTVYPSSQAQPAARCWPTRQRRSTAGCGNHIVPAIT